MNLRFKRFSPKGYNAYIKRDKEKKKRCLHILKRILHLVFLSPRERKYSFKSHSNFSCAFDRLLSQMSNSFKQYLFVAL